jgi:hypothetical protein
MTNPKQSESDTEKKPWAMANPNYKFGKNILSDGYLIKDALVESDDASNIMVALGPRTNAWLKRDESSNALQ